MTDVPTLKPKPPTDWEMVGEDADAMSCDGHHPKDWRTVARALRAYAGDVGRWDAVELWRSTASDGGHADMVKHGWKCEAPPGQWWGGWYVIWSRVPAERNPAPDSWVLVDEEPHEHDPDEGCPGDLPDGAVCLDLDDTADEEAVRQALGALGPEIVAASLAPGDSWACRLIGPVTVVDLDP